MIVKRFSEGGGYYKGTLAILLSDGTVVYLDCGDKCMIVSVCQN